MPWSSEPSWARNDSKRLEAFFARTVDGIRKLGARTGGLKTEETDGKSNTKVTANHGVTFHSSSKGLVF